jgi:hypothetical protein
MRENSFLVTRQEHDRARRAHARELIRSAGQAMNLPAGGLHGGFDGFAQELDICRPARDQKPFSQARRFVDFFLDDLAGGSARDLASVMSTHAITDDKQADIWIAQKRVLVVVPDPADIRATGNSYFHAISYSTLESSFPPNFVSFSARSGAFRRRLCRTDHPNRRIGPDNRALPARKPLL